MNYHMEELGHSYYARIVFHICYTFYMKTLTKRYKFRIAPTDAQANYLAENFGFSRYAYNWALGYRQGIYVTEGRSAGWAESDKEFNSSKKELEWLGSQHSSVVAQQAIRDVEQSFNNFFAKRTKFPKFKSRKSEASMTYTVRGFSLKNGKLHLAKCKTGFKIRWSRELPSAPTSVTIIRDASGRYFASFVCKFEAQPLPAKESVIGLDLGIKTFIVDSNNNTVENPKHLQKAQVKLARLQKELSKKQKGSNRREQARLRVAKQHARVKDARLDFLHKTSTSIVSENQVIAIEDLAVNEMMQNKTLAKYVADVGFRTFRTMLEGKCEEHDRDLLVIDRYYPSSKTCSDCGWINTQLKLSERSWSCGGCQATHDRDFNAAKNILAVGLTESLNGRGDKVSHRDPSWVKAHLSTKRQPLKQRPF